jgi:hypothetical protein
VALLIRALICLSLTLAALSSYSQSHAGAVGDPWDSADASIEASVGRATTDLGCGECTTWHGWGSHTFWGSALPCVYGEPNCYQCLDQECTPESMHDLSCSQHHGPCAMTNDEADAVVSAIQRRAWDDVAAALLHNPDRVRVNVARSLVQLVDCQGTVQAQFSVPVDTLVSLSAR